MYNSEGFIECNPQVKRIRHTSSYHYLGLKCTSYIQLPLFRSKVNVIYSIINIQVKMERRIFSYLYLSQVCTSHICMYIGHCISTLIYICREGSMAAVYFVSQLYTAQDDSLNYPRDYLQHGRYYVMTYFSTVHLYIIQSPLSHCNASSAR